ncbi:MAG: hypothetical protein ABIE03_01580 [Patescibacteria group bacterium]|nr:hypothetical protein [Patescibacteria group bacterium]
MKKLLEIGLDVVLFMFVLVIFAVPVLVSFNLDPELYYAEQPQVAGATKVAGENLFGFEVKEGYERSSKIIVLKSQRESNIYKVSFRLLPETSDLETFKIGSLANEGTTGIKFVSRLYGDKSALKGSTIWLKTGDKERTMFDGKDFLGATFELMQDESFDVEIVIESNQSIHFETDLKFEVRSVAEVN